MPDDITALLADASDGESAAADRLFSIIYGELRKIARPTGAAEPAMKH